MTKRFPNILSSTASNYVIALNNNECAKVFLGDTRSDIGSESEKMKYANNINDLVVKYIRLEENVELDADMLVMERLIPLGYRAYQFSVRELLLDLFLTQVEELHKNGFVHRDISRPSNLPGDKFDNIFLTENRIRLIDVGISVLKHQVSESMFAKYIDLEKKELEAFGVYFLNR